ncbi:hypothetical protein NTG1052_390019 [Candidatus Nitrotoga sp. 1052]|nr:hypothetical protein NTG1052_390019 [Candidatus Nitrotoga sp. 1052]
MLVSKIALALKIYPYLVEKNYWLMHILASYNPLNKEQ